MTHDELVAKIGRLGLKSQVHQRTCHDCGGTFSARLGDETCHTCNVARWRADFAENEARLDRQAEQVARYALGRFLAEL